MTEKLTVVPFAPKADEPLDNSLIIGQLEKLLASAKTGELTGLAAAWAEADGAVTTWWGTASGGNRRHGHINDLASGIARLNWRYHNEAFNPPMPEPV